MIKPLKIWTAREIAIQLEHYNLNEQFIRALRPELVFDFCFKQIKEAK